MLQISYQYLDRDLTHNLVEVHELVQAALVSLSSMHNQPAENP